MKHSEDDPPTRGKGMAHRRRGRGTRSSGDQPDHSAAAQDELPTSRMSSKRAAQAADKAQRQEQLSGESAAQLVPDVKAMQDELLNSRTIRFHAALENLEIRIRLLGSRKVREQLAQELEKLRTRGSRHEAALKAFEVATVDGTIASLENMLKSTSDAVALEEAFEVIVTGGDAACAELTRCAREDGGAPAQAGDARERISALGRAFAGTGNPLHVWEALSLLCVPPIVGDASDTLLPGWCVDYLGRAAEALLGLPPPGMLPEGELEREPRAVSHALGLTRQGWNAYQERQKDRDRKGEAGVYARVKALGIADKDAKAAATEFWNLGDERSVRRRLSGARKAKAC